MATTMPWGESVELLMELGFPVDVFTLDSATDGVLDTDYLDGTLLGDDVSPYAQVINVSRGRKDDFSNFDAGTLSVTLRNDDRRFDPTNTAGPYWDPITNRSGLTPRRAVRLICNGVNVFVGRITDIDIEYDPSPSGTSTATISAVDDFGILSTAFINADVTPTSQLSSARINTILDRTEVAYPIADRDIETGSVTLGTQQIDANTNVLTYLQNIGETEWGLLFINKDGQLAFRKRQTAVFDDVQAEFNDNGTDLPYQVLQVIYGSEFLYNRVQVQADGGTLQTAEDLASQAEYGILTYAISDALFASDTQALELAQYLRDTYSEPTFWFDEIATPANLISGAQRTTLYGLDMGDQIQLTRHFPNGAPSTVTEVYAIERLGHTITGNSHQVRLGLYQPTIVYEFILDNATFGVMDSDNALA
jgi:hypothetical protein